MGEIAGSLRRGRDADPAAGATLFEQIYPELKRLAHHRLRRNGGGDEINPTMLVRESYLKFVPSGSMSAGDRPAFLAHVGRVMRSVVVDYVRERQSARRGGEVQHIALTTCVQGDLLEAEKVFAIDLALASLQRIAPELRQLVDQPRQPPRGDYAQQGKLEQALDVAQFGLACLKRLAVRALKRARRTRSPQRRATQVHMLS